jgi:hypothetical protein
VGECLLCYCYISGPVWLEVVWGVTRLEACRCKVGLNTSCVSYGRGISREKYDHSSLNHFDTTPLHFLPVLQANTTRSFMQSCSPDDGHNDAQNMLRVN